jgi:E3 ubiquitin-protein ligase SHPRH
VLVEPLLDPAVEAQALGRVDRIGQTEATHVHRWGQGSGGWSASSG